MNTFVVWVLFVYAGTGHSGGPVIVDNIATQRNCEALGTTLVSRETNAYKYTCVAVRKVR